MFSGVLFSLVDEKFWGDANCNQMQHLGKGVPGGSI